MRGEGAGEGMPLGWFRRLPGTAASAALAVALATAVCSTSWAVFLSTRSETFFRMKWNSCRTAFSWAAYTLEGPAGSDQRVSKPTVKQCHVVWSNSWRCPTNESNSACIPARGKTNRQGVLCDVCLVT